MAITAARYNKILLDIASGDISRVIPHIRSGDIEDIERGDCASRLEAFGYADLHTLLVESTLYGRDRFTACLNEEIAKRYSAKQNLMAALLKNEEFIHQYANGLTVLTLALINNLFNNIAAEVARIDPTAPRLPHAQLARTKKLLAKTQALADKTYAEVSALASDKLPVLGVQQGVYARRVLLPSFLGGLASRFKLRRGRLTNTRAKVRELLRVTSIQGRLLSEWYDVSRVAVVSQVARAVRLGLEGGETVAQIIERVRGVPTGRTGRYTGGVHARAGQGMRAVIRTAVTLYR